MTEPEHDRTAAAGGRGRLRASRADRERVIELLKVAFVQDRLTHDELETRIGLALASRTYADLADLTADIPADIPAAAAPGLPLNLPLNLPVRQPGHWPERPAGRGSACSSRSPWWGSSPWPMRKAWWAWPFSAGSWRPSRRRASWGTG